LCEAIPKKLTLPRLRQKSPDELTAAAIQIPALAQPWGRMAYARPIYIAQIL